MTRASTDTTSLRDRLQRANNVVVLTGAGISAPSGLRTYRGPGGLWTTNEALAKQLVAGVDPQALWSVTREWRSAISHATPNAAHHALAAFERRASARGAAFMLITQNIDGLHVQAGSQSVIELHGAIRRSRCSRSDCDEPPFVDARTCVDVPACARCRAPVRPDIVLFEERLGALEEWTAKKALRDVDLFVAIGTSGTVSPASGFVRSAEYDGAHTALLNLEVPSNDDESPFDESHAGDAALLVARYFA